MKTLTFGALACIASLAVGCHELDENLPGSTALALAAVCGDGNLDPGEQCDDGNTADHDGCSATCTREIVMQFSFPGATGTEATFAADLVDGTSRRC